VATECDLNIPASGEIFAHNVIMPEEKTENFIIWSPSIILHMRSSIIRNFCKRLENASVD